MIEASLDVSSVRSRGPTPLDASSLTWIYAGDYRMLLLSVRAGLLQLMHPAIGAAVIQHSRFIEAPWERLGRSLAPVMTAIYGGARAAGAAGGIRHSHKRIAGVDERGRTYHGLEPHAFFWAHATIFENVLQTAHLFGKPLTLEEKERFYEESKQWYRLYGVSARAMPPTWRAFCDYFDRICRDVLEPTPAALHLLDRLHGRVPTVLPWLPAVITRALTPPAFKLLWFITLGTLPAVVRERLGYTWDPADEPRLARIQTLVQRGWPLLPRPVRYLPLAYRAIRAAERAPASGPA